MFCISYLVASVSERRGEVGDGGAVHLLRHLQLQELRPSRVKVPSARNLGSINIQIDSVGDRAVLHVHAKWWQGALEACSSPRLSCDLELSSQACPTVPGLAAVFLPWNMMLKTKKTTLVINGRARTFSIGH